jgi:biotin-independent malonate decarboxylase beta subunit
VNAPGRCWIGSYRELLDPFAGMMSPWLAPQGVVPQSDDGMVVARGTINGQSAVVIAIEGTFQGGSMGEVSGAKMAAALELAAKNRNGIPTLAVLCLETGGVRLQEANLGLAAPTFMRRLWTCVATPRWSALSPAPSAASAGCLSPPRCAAI